MLVVTTKAVYRAGSQFATTESSHIAPETAPPVITATAYPGALTISDNGAGGTFSGVTVGPGPGFAASWTYTPANKTQSVLITVTDNVSGPVSVTIAVTATLPIQPMYGYEFDTPSSTKVAVAKDNTPKFRRIPSRQAVWVYSYLNRTIMDVSVMKTFEEWHDIDREFYVSDPELVQLLKVRFDSSIKVRVNGANNFEMTCIVKIYKLTTLSIPTAYTP